MTPDELWSEIARQSKPSPPDRFWIGAIIAALAVLVPILAALILGGSQMYGWRLLF